MKAIKIFILIFFFAASLVALRSVLAFGGTGADGAISTSTTFNINTEASNGRTCADAVAHNLTKLNSASATTSAAVSAGCLAANDVVMLINLQGDGTYYGNVGNYEFLRIKSVSSNDVYFTSPKIKFYGNTTSTGDSNIGINTTNQRVIIQRIPQYTDVTISSGGTMTADAWDGQKGGVFVFWASGTVEVESGGTITMSEKGYRYLDDFQGETYVGIGSDSANAFYGGGGTHYSTDGYCGWTSNAGGGYGSKGENGISTQTAFGGNIYGQSTLSTLFFGSSGGSRYLSGNGGGGIIRINAENIILSGGLSSQGIDAKLTTGIGIRNAAGGAGGSIYLSSKNLQASSSKISAIGGVYDYGWSADCGGETFGGGGLGRVKLVADSLTGTSTPLASSTDILSKNFTPIIDIYNAGGTDFTDYTDYYDAVNGIDIDSDWTKVFSVASASGTLTSVNVTGYTSGATASSSVRTATSTGNPQLLLYNINGTFLSGERVYVTGEASTSNYAILGDDGYQAILAPDIKPVTGYMISEIFDPGLPVVFGDMLWTASTSASSTLTMYVRTGTTSDMTSATDWSACTAVTNQTDITSNNCVTDGDRYFQYKAVFQTYYTGTSTFTSAELYDVEIKYGSVGALTSSVFDTGVDDNVLTSVYWTESISGNADVLVQLRTSRDASTWTDWFGPSGAGSFYTDDTGGETIYSEHMDGASDQYFQYRVWLDSGGSDLPVLTDITVAYEAKYPNVDSLSPNYSDTNATTTVQVSGSDFVDGAVVTVNSWGRVVTASTTFVNSGLLIADLPLYDSYGGKADVIVTNPNEATSSKPFWIKSQVASFVSQIKDLGASRIFGNASWTADTPASTSLAIKVRSSNDSDMSGATPWSSCTYLTSGEAASNGGCLSDGHRYIQYHAYFTSEYPNNYIATTSFITPELQDFSLEYVSLAPGALISSPYNTNINNNMLQSVSWTEITPAGTDVKIQVRTALDDNGAPGNWTAWTGFSGEDTYYTAATTGSGIYASQRYGSGNQWLQYKIILGTDGLSTPTVADVTLEYGPGPSTVKYRGNIQQRGSVIFH